MNRSKKRKSAARVPAAAAAACASVLILLALTAVLIRKNVIKTEAIPMASIGASLIGGIVSVLVCGEARGMRGIAAGALSAALVIAVGCSLSGDAGLGTLPIICAVCLVLPGAAARLRTRGAAAGKRRIGQKRH